MNIVFDIYPSHGHQRSTHQLAKLLKGCGHQVYYIGQQRYFSKLPSEISKQYINPYIYRFVELQTNSVAKILDVLTNPVYRSNIHAMRLKKKETFHERFLIFITFAPSNSFALISLHE